MQIRSERFATAGEQPVGRLKGTGEGRVLVTAHFDTKPDTPGALDNAAGTAVVLAVAELLKEARPAPPAGRRGPTVELVAFNGEDHLSSPGEVAYLEAYPRTDDVRLVINVDGAGLPGAPSTVCRFNTGEALDRELDALLGTMPGLAPTEPWFAGDHAIFAMRGVPALAITSSDLARLTEEIAHTPADRPELVDPAVLADAARFVAAVIRRLVA